MKKLSSNQVMSTIYNTPGENIAGIEWVSERAILSLEDNISADLTRIGNEDSWVANKSPEKRKGKISKMEISLEK